MRNCHTRQRGYALTLALVLAASLLLVGLLPGLILLRDSVVGYLAWQHSEQVRVYHAGSGSVPAVELGTALGYDEHETPLLPFVDYLPVNGDPAQTLGFRTLLGVRDWRFTSAQHIYYTSANCRSYVTSPDPDDQACILAPGAGADLDNARLAFLAALQARASSITPFAYGIGSTENNVTPGDSGQPGWLWRQTASQCPADVRSRWNSQSLASDPAAACEPVAPGTIPSGSLFTAELVPDPEGSNRNILDRFLEGRPFLVNTPIAP